MNFLYYLEPFIERQRPFWKAGWLDFAKTFAKPLKEVGGDFRLLIGEPLESEALKRGFAREELYIADYQPFIGKVGRDYLDITSRWYNGEDGDVLDVFAAYAERLLGDYKPDVIFSFSPAPFLKRVFPDAQILNIEVGMFSRKPFPMTLYFDACGMFRDSYLCRHAAAINAFRAGPEALHFISQLRERYLDDGLRKLLPIAEDIYGERLNAFSRSVLLPLQFSDYYAFDANCEFSSQFDYLQHVLRNVSADIAVVVTEHPENPAVTDEIYSYLKARHPNLIWDARGRDIYACSQLVLLLCDAVVTVTSSVGMHALFYQRPLIALGDSYMTPFADAHRLECLDDVLAKGFDAARDHALYWLFSHYYVLFESIYDGDWFKSFCLSVGQGVFDEERPVYTLAQLHDAYLTGDKPNLEGVLRGSLGESSTLAAVVASAAVEIDRQAPESKSTALAPVAPGKPAPRADDLLRLIAFHLPQFHAIPENDTWWGKGFTEWDNVKLGRPLFDEHYQPHVPAEDLGYYNLLDVETLRRQAELARSHGVYGFCFYYYWFDRKRLLEKPVDLLLANPDIDLPFCLCWANENWTRRWDGGDKEILIAQSYSPELSEKFAEDLIPYFSDPRYIRVEGKPVLLVYRSDIIPDLQTTLETWRQTWRDAGIGEAYLVGVESFKFFSPSEAGFDANCEFLPHQVDFSVLAPEGPLTHPRQHIQSIGDYEKLADFWSSRPRAEYKRFRGLVPSWDNSARRRKGGATMLVNASPEAYKDWLGTTLRKTLEEFEGDERLVFINAWNEWGEGCHLEPDVKHGLAYLEATREAVNEAASVAGEIAVRPDPASDSFVADYGHWVAGRTLSVGEADNLPARIEGYAAALRFAVVISDHDGSPELLGRTLRSVDEQCYHAGSIIVFSAQRRPGELSDRILWLESDSVWSGINDVIPSVEADWFYLLRAGDVLDAHALVLLNDRLNAEPSLSSIYADEDALDGAHYRDPFFKPDFNLDFLRSYPYCGRTLAFEKDAFLAVGGFDPSFGELSPHDVMFRLVENRGLGSIGHIAEVLVHCDRHMGHWLAEDEVIANAPRLTSNHLTRLGIAHSITQGALPMINRVAYHNASQPLVSIIIPTRDQLPVLQRCVESLIEKTRYANYELLIVDNASETPEAIAWLAGMEQLGSDKVRILRYPKPFNYSAINNFAAEQARGEYLVLLNNDTAIIEAGWLDALLNHARRPEVGIVGAKLHFLDGTIQHGGVVLGLGGPADHPFIGEPADAPGYMHRLLVDQNYTVVTAACLMIRASVYAEVGGLDEDDFKVSYNDVDLGLKVRYAGYLTVWTPYAVLVHEGSVSQRNLDSQYASSKKERFNSEQLAMYARWLPQIAEDPAYNKNLTLYAGGFSLAAESERFYWQPFAEKAVPSILCHAADAYGGGQYRVLQPYNALAQAGLAQGGYSRYLLTPAQVERFKPDSVILQRQLLEPQINYVSRLKAFSTALKVYELDDYIIELPLGSQHRADFSREVVRSLRKVLSLCDRFVVSTEPLAAALAGMHSDIRVVRNTLAPESWNGLQGQRRSGPKPRVGWAGGLGHGGDLKMIADLVRALAGEVDWVFMGMCPDELLPFMAEYHPGVPFDRYPERLASLDLDLALAPLEQNRFNECKSNLRLLEYGACGFPVVCSDIEPYRCDLPVTLVKNRYKDWLNAIRAHLQDLDAAAAMGAALQTKVRAEWMLEGDNLLAWRNAWLPD
ncbi:glycoside hydrolase family 99-like domain-containing protein [Pseudomonas kuykendallii]|uniref:glycoside hydrolase family 99-like domain-containing protein n=1 Tax=Pseudomonas kuykendallii TaxID=1007099 RepID=UPI0028D3C0E2|nr:glycoside hydrolase family 99-like domain-containing protein [Pseudomonas kuykendallii]